MLPPEIALFPDRTLNYDLYVWLMGYMAIMPGDFDGNTRCDPVTP